jgi:hypothetical protein
MTLFIPGVQNDITVQAEISVPIVCKHIGFMKLICHPEVNIDVFSYKPIDLWLAF